jgi:hypothetical protein
MQQDPRRSLVASGKCLAGSVAKRTLLCW